MFLNCSDNNISIVGDNNTVYLKKFARNSHNNCRVFYSTFLTDVIFIITICVILLFCIGCCYFKRPKHPHSRTSIGNNEC